MTAAKLNPCGCGGDARLIWTHYGDDGDDMKRLHCAKCKKCRMETDDYMTEEEAAAAWNAAHPPAIKLVDIEKIVDSVAEEELTGSDEYLYRPDHASGIDKGVERACDAIKIKITNYIKK